MKTIMKKRLRVVESEDGAIFEASFNAIMDEVCGKGIMPEVSFPDRGGKHCAYISYTEQMEFAETIVEEHEMRGEHDKCRDCPMFHPPLDGRKKWERCGYGIATSANSKVCEKFYEGRR